MILVKFFVILHILVIDSIIRWWYSVIRSRLRDFPRTWLFFHIFPQDYCSFNYIILEYSWNFSLCEKFSSFLVLCYLCLTHLLIKKDLQFYLQVFLILLIILNCLKYFLQSLPLRGMKRRQCWQMRNPSRERLASEVQQRLLWLWSFFSMYIFWHWTLIWYQSCRIRSRHTSC